MTRTAIYHDSNIRSDWLPIGGRGVAERLMKEVLDVIGTERGRDHEGRRDRTTCDTLTITSPIEWKERRAGIQQHLYKGKTYGDGGPCTIKIRGCDGYRARAKAIARTSAAAIGITWGLVDRTSD